MCTVFLHVLARLARPASSARRVYRLRGRMYCFEDGDRRIILHVHTPFRWGDRKQKDPKQRTEFVTSANVRHAWLQKDGQYEQEQGKWFLVPKAKVLQTGWRELSGDVTTWRWDTERSIPKAERADRDVVGRYDEVRRVIQLGESLRYKQRTETLSWKASQAAIRGGMPEEKEYEVVAVDTAADSAVQSKPIAARSALIVAVSEYECDNVANLANTDIDAAKLKAVLLQLGWHVEMATDLGLKATEKKIKEFAKSRATGESDCLLAIVGHGIEINGRNYLVTADSKLEREYDDEAEFEKDVQRTCLEFAEVQVSFKKARGSASGVTLFVLDCCRSGFNTIVGGGRSVAASFMSRAAGSSQIRPDFPNSHIIYSTTSGSVASDGERGKGGPFMSIFTEEIKPDQEVRKVTQATRKRLRESAPDLCQLAPENSLLERDFYFGLGPTRQDRAGESAAAASVAAAAAAPSSPAAGADEALQALLREHGVEDALPWLVREGVTRCEHLRDVTEQELHDSGLGKFAVRR